MAKKKQDKSKNIPPQYKEQKLHIQAVEQPKSAFFKENWLPIAIIVFFSIGLYIQTVTFDYALDDTMVIVKNKFTQRGFSGIGDIFKYESFRGYFGEQKQLLEGDRYRPLSIATFAAEQSLFGSNKAVSHFINILLYALTGVLLFRVLLFMPAAPRPPKGENVSLPSNVLTRNSPFGGWGAGSWAAMAALLFVVHPLHVEVVANIKGCTTKSNAAIAAQDPAPQPPKGEKDLLPSNELERNSPFGGRGACAWAACINSKTLNSKTPVSAYNKMLIK